MSEIKCNIKYDSGLPNNDVESKYNFYKDIETDIIYARQDNIWVKIILGHPSEEQFNYEL